MIESASIKMRIASRRRFDYARSMNGARDLTSIASLLGDKTRALMLMTLMDGRAWTATELALAGGVSASTASSHLQRLVRAGVLEIRRQGRHRYFRIASPEHAGAIEGLANLAPQNGHAVRAGPRDLQLRNARICYDHLAGAAGVRLLERLRALAIIAGEDDTPILTHKGEAWCAKVGLQLDHHNGRSRPLLRTCLDWSERRSHLAGALGAAILERLLDLRYARRVRDSRAVILSERGEAFIERLEPL
jgi:DNA-binding transcriptional ArsR family regulator